MRVRVSDPALLRDLILYLRECGCVAEQASRDEAEVWLPATLNEHAARMELGVYLSGWRLQQRENPSAEIVS